MVWNGRVPERFRETIVATEFDADVIEAVKLARSRGLRISLYAARRCDLIDVSKLNGVTVDTAARTDAEVPGTDHSRPLHGRDRFAGLAYSRT